MNKYITGAFIKTLRENNGLTQQQLADKLYVSEKAVSKWETGKGYPDISLLESIAAALGVSVIELMAGNNIKNNNRSSNIKNVKFYVCPICGNIITSVGEAVVCCCGVNLPPLELESNCNNHIMTVENIEDEIYLHSDHPMTKEHYISFIAVIRDNMCELIKLYPEGNCEARVRFGRIKHIYFYCNRDGLFKLL